MTVLIIIGLIILYLFIGVISLLPFSFAVYGDVFYLLGDDDPINLVIVVFWPVFLPLGILGIIAKFIQLFVYLLLRRFEK